MANHSPNNRTTTVCPLILARPSTSIIFDAIVFGTSTNENRSRISPPPLELTLLDSQLVPLLPQAAVWSCSGVPQSYRPPFLLSLLTP